MYVESLFLVTFFLVLFIAAWIRIRHPFWSLQPVFHNYDVWRYCVTQPSVISTVAVTTKFINYNKVKTRNYLEASDLDVILDVIQCHFLPSDRVTYTLTAEHLRTLCSHHSSGPCWVSTYSTDHYRLLADVPSAPATAPAPAPATVINEPDVAGVLIAYPVRMVVGSASFVPIFFWDFIVMHRDTGKDVNTIRTLIQTHEANQRRLTDDIPASLFRKDVELSEGIVPLVQFTVSKFEVIKERIKRPPLLQTCTVTKVRTETMHGLLDFLYTMTTTSSRFNLCLFPDLTALEARIERNEWQVYTLQASATSILAAYFFRDTHTVHEDNGGQMECIVSVALTEDPNLFFAAWLHALYDLLQTESDDKAAVTLTMGNLGHNATLVEKYTWKYKPLSTHQSAYYVYNYVCPGMPLAPDRCWIAL
jgi:hypothetical protein